MRGNAERSIEALTWASVVIWLGFALITHILGYVWLVLMVLGIILLTSAIYQRSRGWNTSVFTWIAGIWMAVFSVVEVVDELVGALNNKDSGLGIDIWVYLGIALVSMGVAVILRNAHVAPSVFESGARKTTSRTSRYTTQEDDLAVSRRRAPVVPRQVKEDYSVGSTESASRSRATPRVDNYRARSADRYQPTVQQQPVEPRAQPGRARPADRRRTARPAEEPADLESRVEDIIRRSRERRTPGSGSGSDSGNLPY
ncbi:MAG TPA: hypothetical protein VHP83_26330 [Aggregatilineaceae bacterium]|nr:hypothetical protein [Aggregatilineaceae bacterium]